jgi:hypothetical protein
MQILRAEAIEAEVPRASQGTRDEDLGFRSKPEAGQRGGS